MNKEVKTKKEVKVGKNLIIVFVASILIAVIAMIASSTPPQPSETTPPGADTTLPEPTDAESFLRHEWRDKYNIESTNSTEEMYDGEDTIPATLFADVYVEGTIWTAKAFVDATSRNVAELARDIFARYDQPDLLHIRFSLDYEDRYGNIEAKPALNYRVPREIVEKVNWDNFNTTNFCNLLITEGALAELTYCFGLILSEVNR